MNVLLAFFFIFFNIPGIVDRHNAGGEVAPNSLSFQAICCVDALGGGRAP